MKPNMTKAAPASAASPTSTVPPLSASVCHNPTTGVRQTNPADNELVLEVGTRHTAWLLGERRRVVPLLTAVGCARQWDGQLGAWSFPRRCVDDVLARAEYERRPLQLRRVDR
jgi:hypothetical protein